MSGAKGAKLAARAGQSGPRKHYCPTCIAETECGEIEVEMEAKPVMIMPKRRIFFVCKAGHRSTRGQTVLA